ncbi:YqhV family protein [Bacillus sp. AK031]
MFVFIEKALLAMVALRILSGSIEIGAALLMLKFNDLHKAFMINSLLAFVGPTIFFSTTAIGLAGLSGRISPLKASCLIAGVLLIGLSIKIK